MDHSLQHQYLQTLGILQYVPKDTVYEEAVYGEAVGENADTRSDSVAKIEMPATTVEGVDVSKPDSGFGQSTNKKSVDIAALVNLGLDHNPTAPAKAKVAASKPSAAVNSEPAAVIEVKFSLWQITDELLVCSAVEGALAETAEMQLLTNILNAIGCGIGRLPQMDLIEWPPYPNAPNDEAEAREYLATLLAAKLADKPVKTVLMFGDSAGDWLVSPDSEQATALRLPSLATMIEKPQQKAVAWQALQVLLPPKPSAV